MRIGIITIQKCNNFGSDLQAFALQRKLQQMGHEAENIDYLFYKNPRHIKTRMSRPTFHVSLKNKIKEFLYPKKLFLARMMHMREERKRQLSFDRFVSDNFRLSQEYRTVDELFRNPPSYDAYMVGSDELWNPRCNSSMLPFFLDFAPKGAKKIAYAASTGGRDNYDERTRNIFMEHLRDFSSISMREKSSCTYFADMLGREVKHVVDPTLLLDAQDWNQVSARTSVSEPYIAVYDLIPSPQLWSMAHRLSANSGLKIIRICGASGMKKIDGVDQYSEIGPGEFIDLVGRASCVLTNSFHGTVFSILYQKPFYFVIPGHMTDSGRIGSLLTSLSLEARMVWDKDADSINEFGTVDWHDVSTKLGCQREASVSYLDSALKI